MALTRRSFRTCLRPESRSNFPSPVNLVESAAAIAPHEIAVRLIERVRDLTAFLESQDLEARITGGLLAVPWYLNGQIRTYGDHLASFVT